MPIIDSRLKTGVLAFGGATPRDFSCQPTNVKLTPSTNTEDPVETLCGLSIAGAGSTTWVLAGTAIQDFDDVSGFVLFAFNNDGETVPFTWTPNPDSGTWSGTCIVQAVELGGDVNTRLTTDFTFSVNGKPLLTPA